MSWSVRRFRSVQLLDGRSMNWKGYAGFEYSA